MEIRLSCYGRYRNSIPKRLPFYTCFHEIFYISCIFTYHNDKDDNNIFLQVRLNYGSVRPRIIFTLHPVHQTPGDSGWGEGRQDPGGRGLTFSMCLPLPPSERPGVGYCRGPIRRTGRPNEIRVDTFQSRS